MSAMDQDQRAAGTQPAPEAAAAAVRRRCKIPALILWQAEAEDRPEGTPVEKQDPQRRQDPHKKHRPADRTLVVAR